MQLAELEELANILAIREYGGDLGFLLNQNVDNLVRLLTTPTSGDLTLQQRVEEIATALTENASNNKLKKAAKEHVQNNQTKKIAKGNEALSNKPEPISPQS